jgi:hypothetical protein
MVQVYLKIKNPLTAEVKRQAAAARAVIESYNAPSRLRHVDTAVMGNARGGWNYGIGEYNGALLRIHGERSGARPRSV